MRRISYTTDFVIRNHDILFFDTNVWLNLFTPEIQETDAVAKALKEKAAACYKQACEKGTKIYTSSIVISEFVNRYLKIMYAAEKSENPRKYSSKNAYKEVFRKSEKYKEYLEEVLYIVEHEILETAQKTDDAFSQFEINDYSNRENKEYLDFNDYCIEHICRKRNYKLVTSDLDFKKANAKCDVLYIA